MSVDHVTGGTAGGLLALAVHWGWRLLRRERHEARLEGAVEQRFLALERSHADLGNRLDRIGADVAEVRKLFTTFLIEQRR